MSIADHIIPWQDALKMHDYEPDLENEDTRRMLLDSVVPACCDEGCEVEPDGRCEHECPAVTIVLGLI